MQEYIQNHSEIAWMLFGATLLVLEVSVAPAMGMLFGGFAALSVGGLMAFGVLENQSFYVQLAWFFGLTCAWAVLLWRPMQKIRSAPSQSFKDIVGTTAIVTNVGLKAGKIGSVKWSGANMRARLAGDSSAVELKEGQQVWVHEIEDSTLVVDVVPPVPGDR